jgi:hypothetical protein
LLALVWAAAAKRCSGADREFLSIGSYKPPSATYPRLVQRSFHMKVILWIIGIIFLIGLLVVLGVGGLIF